MIKNPNPKGFGIRILNFEIVWNLVLGIWNFLGRRSLWKAYTANPSPAPTGPIWIFI
jgi:hypothetical protein